MKLAIRDEYEIPFVTSSSHWIGVVDLSNLEHLNVRISPQEGGLLTSHGLYPWYGISGNIVSIREVES